jgi:uncharacterized protein (TIGR03437 family)
MMSLRILSGVVALVSCALPPLEAGDTLVPSADGITVYDTVNNITWLANANLPASNRFGLPLCNASAIAPCVNASGSMTYKAAAAWVQAMNAANYLGHTNWQIPTAPVLDSTCPLIGGQGGSFGFGCLSSALASLYYNGLGLQIPNTAVPIPIAQTGPFNSFQPYLYWSQTMSLDGSGISTLSLASGYQGGNVTFNFLYVIPTIPGKMPGTPPATGKGLQVNPGGLTVYDPVTNVTWLANGNVAATNTFGLPTCKDQNTPKVCVAQDGAMTWNTASQFLANMNSYNGTGFLGQTNWQLPAMDPTCGITYDCGGAGNVFQELYYGQLGLSPGTPIVPTPNTTVGPFSDIQPFLYWECGADKIQDPCTYAAAPNFEWSFSFGNGFLGTDILANDLYVTVYFVGNRASTSGPVIAEVANAEGESPTIAPNTWLEIKGANLAPPGDSRTWQSSDFVGTQMPVALDKVSATVNGKNAYIYYISPAQVNILPPPDAMNGPVQVVVTNNGTATASFTAQAQSISPSFFVFNGGPYIIAEHLNGSLIGPPTLYPGSSTPAKPGEIVVIYANGFGPTNVPVSTGSTIQSGTLSPLPAIQIGGVAATVQFAGLVAPGEFQFNVIIPASLGNGDQPITATYGGASTQSGALITIHN